MLTQRETQAKLVALLRPGSHVVDLLVRSFPAQPYAVIVSAVQQVVLETLADLYLRFSVHYSAFPFRLLHIIFDSVAPATKQAFAE
eukprot:3329599-Alexandrium_andersonii.AAC.1